MESDTKFWAILMTVAGGVMLAIPLGVALSLFSYSEDIERGQAVFSIMFTYFGAIFCGFAGAFWYKRSLERRQEEQMRFVSMMPRF